MGSGGAFPFAATPDQLVRRGFLPIGPRTERAAGHYFSTSAAAPSLASVFVFLRIKHKRAGSCRFCPLSLAADSRCSNSQSSSESLCYWSLSSPHLPFCGLSCWGLGRLSGLAIAQPRGGARSSGVGLGHQGAGLGHQS